MTRTGSVTRRSMSSSAREAVPIERMLGVRERVNIEIEGRRTGDEPVVDPTGSESTLDNLEATAPAADEVGDGHSDIVVDDLVVTFGSIVVAELQGSATKGQQRWRARRRRRYSRLA
jgi:hypothetical protein